MVTIHRLAPTAPHNAGRYVSTIATGCCQLEEILEILVGVVGIEPKAFRARRDALIHVIRTSPMQLGCFRSRNFGGNIALITPCFTNVPVTKCLRINILVMLVPSHGSNRPFDPD